MARWFGPTNDCGCCCDCTHGFYRTLSYTFSGDDDLDKTVLMAEANNRMEFYRDGFGSAGTYADLYAELKLCPQDFSELEIIADFEVLVTASVQVAGIYVGDVGDSGAPFYRPATTDGVKYGIAWAKNEAGTGAPSIPDDTVFTYWDDYASENATTESIVDSAELAMVITPNGSNIDIDFKVDGTIVASLTNVSPISPVAGGCVRIGLMARVEMTGALTQGYFDNFQVNYTA